MKIACMCTAAVLLLSAPTAAHARSEVHPRLFVDRGRIEEVRAAIRVPGSHHQEAFGAMRARVDRADWRVYTEQVSGGGYAAGGNWNYGRSYLAREAALMYLLTDDRRYAQIAFDALSDVHHDPDPDGRLPEAGYGLARATVGMGFAIAYDWAYHGFTPEQRAYLLDKLRLALDAWPAYHHANLETEHQGSNWVAVSRGGELVMILAAYEEDDRPERFRMLRSSLRRHMETAYGPSGWSQEGVLYTSYAGQFLLPAVYALQSIGDDALDEQLRRIGWWRLLMAVGSFTPEKLHLMSGVDGGFGNDDQGWTSLVLNAVPRDSLPFYQYFYDRHMGRKAPLPPDQKYDPLRAGTTWALLYYPEEMDAADPDGAVSRTLFDDRKGAYFFRNRWDNGEDILFSAMGDYDYHGNAWDIQEAFQLGLIAHGTPFIGGPGKEGTGGTATSEGYSALVVDGRAFSAQGRTGAPVLAEARADGGGYVVLEGGEKYAGLGVRQARRHVRVDFPGAGAALLGTLDVLRTDRLHTYHWQINPGGPRGDDRVRVTTGTESGRSSFTLYGRDGAFLKGWVLHPSTARIVGTDPLRIEARGADAEIWVAMLLDRGDPPTARIEGEGLGSTLRIANHRVRFDAGADRIMVDSSAPR